MDILYSMALVSLGVVLGIILGLLIRKKTANVGVLQIDRSQPNRGPFIFLELNSDIDWYQYKKVELTVLNQDLAYRE